MLPAKPAPIRLKLTNSVVRQAKPASKSYIMWDTEIRGFGCRIYPTSERHPFGKKVWIAQGHRHNSPGQFRKRIGVFDIVDAETARREAREIFRLAQCGEVPKPKALPITFGGAFDKWAAIAVPLDRLTDPAPIEPSVRSSIQCCFALSGPGLQTQRA
jgi:hypothetical protein